MKITFLLPHVRLSGGVRALLEYANRLNRMGHDVGILLFAEPHKWYRFDKKLKSLGKKPVDLNPKFIDWFDNHVPITRLPFNDKAFFPPADVLVASAWQTAQFAATIPDSAGKKFYFIQHYESLWTRDKERAEKTYRLPFQKIVISSWLKQILADNYQQEANLLVTPVDNNLFFSEEKIWNTPPRVCLLHHDYDWKGYKEGIAAIKKVRSLKRNVELVVFGEKLKDPGDLFEHAGFEFEYHYRPTGDQVAKIFSSCDIYICPSWHEGLGMPAMEAMATGCAVVTTDTGGSQDYAIDRETALVSPPRDVEALAKNLIAVLDDNQLMARLAKNGQRKIMEFDWDKNCKQLIDLFAPQKRKP
jgi:glycosyltransferase involved in cell wall biosynthesis